MATGWESLFPVKKPKVVVDTRPATKDDGWEDVKDDWGGWDNETETWGGVYSWQS